MGTPPPDFHSSQKILGPDLIRGSGNNKLLFLEPNTPVGSTQTVGDATALRATFPLPLNEAGNAGVMHCDSLEAAQCLGGCLQTGSDTGLLARPRQLPDGPSINTARLELERPRGGLLAMTLKGK